ncbi:MAG: hypothetical protein ACYC3S_12310 [Chloroflexota bacterium]
MEELERLLTLHGAFWRRENVRPLCQITSGPRLEDLQQLTDPLPEGLIDPAAIAPTRLVRPFSAAIRPGSDFFQPLVPPNMSWTEGMIGCPVYVTAGESTWAAPVHADWPERLSPRFDPLGPWQRLLLGTLRTMADTAAGRLPVAQPMMRGPLDMAGALLPPALVCAEAHLNPARLHDLLRQCAEVWWQSNLQVQAALPAWHGGHCNVYGVWSPGTAARLQEDTSALFSPRHYEEFLLPLDRLLAGTAEYPVMHMHSDSLRHVGLLLDAPEIRAIQVAVDMPPFGPEIADLVPVLRRILARKPLIVYAYDPLSLDEAQRLAGPLPPAGLALKINLATQSEADAFSAWLGR